MKCSACGEKMKLHERIEKWEKRQWWECPACHTVLIKPRTERKPKP